MLRLAWSVYSSKDFVETKTVTGNLSYAAVRLQDTELDRCPEPATLGKDTGDHGTELEPEPTRES